MRGFFAKIFRGTSAGPGFAQIEEKLKGKAGELGQCLKNIDKVLNSTMPRDEALENVSALNRMTTYEVFIFLPAGTHRNNEGNSLACSGGHCEDSRCV